MYLILHTHTFVFKMCFQKCYKLSETQNPHHSFSFNPFEILHIIPNSAIELVRQHIFWTERTSVDSGQAMSGIEGLIEL